MNKTTAEPTGERLSKRVMALRQCSRSEAERFIAGGWVRVNGVVVAQGTAASTDEDQAWPRERKRHRRGSDAPHS